MSPFAQYLNFADCVSKNKDRKNPQAYCGFIMHQVEGTKKKESSPIKMNSNLPLLKTLLEIMKDTDVRIFKDKGLYGCTNGQYVKTNIKKGDVVNTIIHELMHVNYPEKSEKQIREVSAAVEGSLTMRDQARLLDTYEGNIMRELDRNMMYPNYTTASVARGKTQRTSQRDLMRNKIKKLFISNKK